MNTNTPPRRRRVPRWLKITGLSLGGVLGSIVVLGIVLAIVNPTPSPAPAANSAAAPATTSVRPSPVPTRFPTPTVHQARPAPATHRAHPAPATTTGELPPVPGMTARDANGLPACGMWVSWGSDPVTGTVVDFQLVNPGDLYSVTLIHRHGPLSSGSATMSGDFGEIELRDAPVSNVKEVVVRSTAHAACYAVADPVTSQAYPDVVGASK